MGGAAYTAVPIGELGSAFLNDLGIERGGIPSGIPPFAGVFWRKNVGLRGSRAWIRRSWRRLRAVQCSRRRVLLVLATTYLAFAFALDRYGQREPSESYDAIAVAGCRVMASGEPSPALAHRVRRAVELWKAGRAPLVVFTGGVGEHGPSEAEASARLAEGLGVPRSAMVLEAHSTSTEENARFAARALGRNSRVLVVTSAYHVFRCRRVFARHFGTVDGSGVVESAYPRVQGALREVVAVVGYAVLGRL